MRAASAYRVLRCAGATLPPRPAGHLPRKGRYLSADAPDLPLREMARPGGREDAALGGRIAAIAILACLFVPTAILAGDSTLPTTRTDLTPADQARVTAITAPTQRLLQGRAVRAAAGRRGDVEEARQPGRLLAVLGQPHLRAGRHVQARQRAVPQALGVVAVLDAGLRRARAAVQRARLPELPPEGRARPSAGRQCRRDVDVPAAGPRGQRRRTNAPRSPADGMRSTFRTRSMAAQLQDLAVPGLAGEGRMTDQLRRDARDAGRRHAGLAAQAELRRSRPGLRSAGPGEPRCRRA